MVVVMAATLVVSVGTDHHPFNRLADWVGRWLDNNPAVRCVYQRGVSRAPVGVESVDLIARTDLLAFMQQATVVLTQAGPGSIKDAHSSGRVPIVVPRVRHFGEVVDDHQVAFAEAMAEQGWVWVAMSEDSLHRLLDRAFASPADLVWSETDLSPASAATAFENHLTHAMALPPRRLHWHRLPVAARGVVRTFRHVPSMAAVTTRATPQIEPSGETTGVDGRD